MNNENKINILGELMNEFKDAGATSAELPSYQKIAEIIISEPDKEIPQDLLRKLKLRMNLKRKRFSLPNLLLRTAAVFFLVFFTGLFIIQESSRNAETTTITPVADNSFEKVNVVKAEKLNGEKIAETANKSYSFGGSAASLSLTDSSILAFPYTNILHTNNYILLKKGDIVVTTGSKKLRIVALDMRTDIAPDSVVSINMLADKNEVQFTILSGQADVMLADNRIHNFNADTDRKVMFYKQDFKSPIILKNKQDIEEKVNIVKICTRKIAEAFKIEKIIAITLVKSKNFTIEHLVQNSNSNSLTLLKSVEIDGTSKKLNIIRLNQQDNEDFPSHISLAEGDVISGWTLAKSTPAGLTFTKDSEENFVPYSN